MDEAKRMQLLKYALILVGIIFIFVVYPFTIIWPSGWQWHGGEGNHYLQMILGVYATLGVFLIIASKNPMQHTSLIWFTVWSSVVHAGIMGIQAIMDDMERGHLVGDVPALLIVAALLAFLTPRGKSA